MTRIKSSMHDSNILDNTYLRKHDYETDLITKYVLCGSHREDERRRRDEDGPSNGVQQPALQTTVRRSTRLGRRTSRGEEYMQSRLALPKNLIRPLSVQDHKSEWFRRPALPFAGARRRSGWSNYEGGAAARRGKTQTRLYLVLVEADG